MIKVVFKGKEYRVAYDGSVEVRIPAGEARVMREPRKASWRTLKMNSSISLSVRALAGV